MTQLSYFHNGTMRGDATTAPYEVSLFHDIMGKLLSSNRTYGIVSTGPSWDDLVASSAGTDMEIDVTSGNAFIAGVLFKSDATVSLTLDQATAQSRWDRIVIRVNWEDQTARLVVVKGKESTAPVLPSLQQDEGIIYEFPVARVWVDGSTKSIPTISAYYVYDEREFIHTPQDPPVINIMHNTEFYAGAHTGEGGQAPAYWYTTGIPTIYNFYIPPTQYPEDVLSRGNVLNMTFPATASTLQTNSITSKASSSIWATASRMTLSFYIHVISGQFALLFGGVQLATFWPTADPVHYLLRFPAYSIAPSMQISFAGVGNAHLYPVTLSYGVIPAPFVPQKEIILFSNYGSRSYTRSTSTDNVIPRYSDTNAGIPAFSNYEPGILLWQIAYDSGSAGADSIYAEIKPPANAIRTEIGRLPNSVHGHSIGWVVGLITSGSKALQSDIVASGASTLSQEVRWMGVVT